MKGWDRREGGSGGRGRLFRTLAAALGTECNRRESYCKLEDTVMCVAGNRK